MNVILADTIRYFNLQLHLFEKVDFKDLSMRTVDHKKIVLYY